MSASSSSRAAVLASATTPALAMLNAACPGRGVDGGAAADQQDPSGAGRFEVRDGGPDRAERRTEVEVDHPVEAHVVGVHHVPSSGPASHQCGDAVDPSEPGGDRLHESADLPPVDRVDPPYYQPVLAVREALLIVLRLGRDEVRGAYAVSLGEQPSGEGAAQRSGRSGEYGYGLAHRAKDRVARRARVPHPDLSTIHRSATFVPVFPVLSKPPTLSRYGWESQLSKCLRATPVSVTVPPSTHPPAASVGPSTPSRAHCQETVPAACDLDARHEGGVLVATPFPGPGDFDGGLSY